MTLYSLCYTPSSTLPPSLYRTNLLLLPSIWKAGLANNYFLYKIYTRHNWDQNKNLTIYPPQRTKTSFGDSQVHWHFVWTESWACSINTKKFLRNEALAYLISELVTCLDAVCFSLLVEETAINYGCRKRQKLGEKSKIKFDKAVSPF